MLLLRKCKIFLTKKQRKKNNKKYLTMWHRGTIMVLDSGTASQKGENFFMGDIKYSTLRGEMARNGLTQADMAKLIGVTNASFSNKINGRSPWMFKEVYKIMRRLPDLELSDFLIE